MMRALATLLAVAFGLAPTAVAVAQSGSIHGVVRDTAGKPLENADVGIVALKVLARTNQYGRFNLKGIPLGEHELSVRRLGYDPKTLKASTGERDRSLQIALVPQPAILAAIAVNSTERRRRQWIEDFHRRRVTGLGTYTSREEIRARNSFRPSDMFRNTPGVRIVRDKGLRFNNMATTMNATRDCPPLMWIDGQRAPGIELDELSLTDIEGIELYSTSTTPMQFSAHSSARTCGTVVVWTRPPNSRDP